MKWFPHFQIKNLTKIAEGGFSIVYKATRSYPNGNRIQNQIVAVKSFLYSQNLIKHFLNEVII